MNEGKPLRRLYEIQEKVMPVVNPVELGLKVRLCIDCGESDYYTVYQLHTSRGLIDVGYLPYEIHIGCRNCKYYTRFIRTLIPEDNFVNGALAQVFNPRRVGRVKPSTSPLKPSHSKELYVASLIAAAGCIAAPRQAIGWRNLKKKCWAQAVALRYEPLYSSSLGGSTASKIRSKRITNILKTGTYRGIDGYHPSGLLRGKPMLVMFKLRADAEHVAARIAPTAATYGIYCNDAAECFMFARAPQADMEAFMDRLACMGFVDDVEIDVIRAAKHTTLAWEMFNPLTASWCPSLTPRGLKACHERGIVLWGKAGIISFIKAALQDGDTGAWKQYRDSMDFM